MNQTLAMERIEKRLKSKERKFIYFSIHLAFSSSKATILCYTLHVCARQHHSIRKYKFNKYKLSTFSRLEIVLRMMMNENHESKENNKTKKTNKITCCKSRPVDIISFFRNFATMLPYGSEKYKNEQNFFTLSFLFSNISAQKTINPNFR